MAARPVPQRALLVDAPRSLGALSREHPDGWGLALSTPAGWAVHKSTLPASSCALFERVAAHAASNVAIGHVRQKTVGATALENTHPFARGRFVLAHNGTVKATELLERHATPARRAEIEGQTDSERLFAFLMSFVDRVGDVASGLRKAVTTLLGADDPGSTNFLLSDGERLYAFRFGRTLCLLERRGRSESPSRRTPSCAVASEPLTDEAWTEIEQGTLLQVDRSDAPRAEVLLRV